MKSQWMSQEPRLLRRAGKDVECGNSNPRETPKLKTRKLRLEATGIAVKFQFEVENKSTSQTSREEVQKLSAGSDQQKDGPPSREGTGCFLAKNQEPNWAIVARRRKDARSLDRQMERFRASELLPPPVPAEHVPGPEEYSSLTSLRNFGRRISVASSRDRSTLGPNLLDPVLKRPMFDVISKITAEDPDKRSSSLNRAVLAVSYIRVNNPPGMKPLASNVIKLGHDRDLRPWTENQTRTFSGGRKENEKPKSPSLKRPRQKSNALLCQSTSTLRGSAGLSTVVVPQKTPYGVNQDSSGSRIGGRLLDVTRERTLSDIPDVLRDGALSGGIMISREKRRGIDVVPPQKQESEVTAPVGELTGGNVTGIQSTLMSEGKRRIA
ncbi:hypothetical protein FB451DRAFT_1178692 [Mycena latifolia]|nr:hypothetical protein FB451DRAFT_1178692 [Mycena latifolia]